MESGLRSVERQGGHEAGGAPPTLVDRWRPPLTWIFLPVFFIYSKIILRWFSGHSENFYFCTKITPWQFCWKQRQSGLVPFKSCKLESKTRAKVFGKVDTTETYQGRRGVRKNHEAGAKVGESDVEHQQQPQMGSNWTLYDVLFDYCKVRLTWSVYSPC